MPGDNFLYSFSKDSMQQGMESLGAATKKVQDELTNLNQYATQHLAEWVGDAKDTYYAHKAEWDKAADEMSSLLATGAAPAMQRSLDSYHAAEQKNLNKWTDGFR